MLASQADRPLRFWVQNIDGGAPRTITPEGLDGLFITVNHSDYICARDKTGAVGLYPIDGGDPKRLAGLTETDQVIGGSADSDIVYVSSGDSATRRQVVKVNIANGQRQPFVTVSPADSIGIAHVGRPIFSAEGKRFVYLQVRQLSVLYVATGLE